MKCEVCHADVCELRRGRCRECYNQWVKDRPLGVGARCCICAERRRDLLRSVEFLGGLWPMCHSCSERAVSLESAPETLTEIRHVLARERRGRKPDRRAGQKDTRVFRYERRRTERRLRYESDYGSDMSLEELDDMALNEIALEIAQTCEFDPDLTCIRDLGWTARSPQDDNIDDDMDDNVDDDRDVDLDDMDDVIGWAMPSHAAGSLDSPVELLDI